MPKPVERALSIGPDVLAYALHWEPCGDEAICERILVDGSVITGDIDWRIWFMLEGLNPIMANGGLGSSEEPATHCLLCDNVSGRFYVAPMAAWRWLCLQPPVVARRLFKALAEGM